MRIRRMIIEGLFGLFNHDIPFKTQDRVTIIHGPNGVGKTTILKLIADLFAKRFQSLKLCPYNKLEFVFEKPRYNLSIKRVVPKDPENPIQLKFELWQKNKKIQEHTTKPLKEYKDIYRHLPLHIIENSIEPLEQVGAYKWLDRSTGSILDIDDVIAIYGEQLPFKFPPSFLELPAWLAQLFEKLPTHFIQTQRLFAIPVATAYERSRRKTLPPTTMVERYSEDMVNKIQDSLRQSAVLAASLDRTFPHRLLESEPPNIVTEPKIRERYEQQAQYRSRLMLAGLIDPEEPVALPPGELDKNALRVLYHYLNDVDKKFNLFDRLLKKVELFKEIINSRFLYKTFKVDKEKGFVFTAINTKPVPLQSLSSGEQHELVLGYDLLFLVKEGSLILIDEPELSLHVTWQHKFLEDITRISELADLDFLVATHSPSIIYDKTHLMVELGDHQ
jgi:ABC-type lipoprotein export system ATPase subunit